MPEFGPQAAGEQVTDHGLAPLGTVSLRAPRPPAGWEPPCTRAALPRAWPRGVEPWKGLARRIHPRGFVLYPLKERRGLGVAEGGERACVCLADALWAAVSGRCELEQKFGSVMPAVQCVARVFKDEFSVRCDYC